MTLKTERKIIMMTNKVEMLLNKERNLTLREFAHLADSLGLRIDITEIDHNNPEYENSSDFMYINGDKIPYLRIKDENGCGYYYIRDTGFCCYCSRNDIIRLIKNMKLD